MLEDPIWIRYHPAFEMFAMLSRDQAVLYVCMHVCMSWPVYTGSRPRLGGRNYGCLSFLLVLLKLALDVMLTIDLVCSEVCVYRQEEASLAFATTQRVMSGVC